MKRALALAFASIGAAATLVPWALNRADVWESRVHDGLWFSLPSFALALVWAAGGGLRAQVGFGLFAVAVAGIEIGGVWRNAFGPVDGAVERLLADYAPRSFVSDRAVLISGAALVLIGLSSARRP